MLCVWCRSVGTMCVHVYQSQICWGSFRCEGTRGRGTERDFRPVLTPVCPCFYRRTIVHNPPCISVSILRNFISGPPTHPSAQPLCPAPSLCRSSVRCRQGRLWMPASTRQWSSCERGSGLCITFAFGCGNSPPACLAVHGLRRSSAIQRVRSSSSPRCARGCFGYWTFSWGPLPFW